MYVYSTYKVVIPSDEFEALTRSPQPNHTMSVHDAAAAPHGQARLAGKAPLPPSDDES